MEEEGRRKRLYGVPTGIVSSAVTVNIQYYVSGDNILRRVRSVCVSTSVMHGQRRRGEGEGLYIYIGDGRCINSGKCY